MMVVKSPFSGSKFAVFHIPISYGVLKIIVGVYSDLLLLHLSRNLIMLKELALRVGVDHLYDLINAVILHYRCFMSLTIFGISRSTTLEDILLTL